MTSTTPHFTSPASSPAVYPPPRPEPTREGLPRAEPPEDPRVESPAARLAEEFDRFYEPLDILLFGAPHALHEARERALRIADACGPPGGPIDRELLREIWSLTWHDLAVWLRCLPRILAQRDLLDEAIDLCGRLAPLFDARAFLSERALLLAEAGRSAEALRQAQTNLRLFRSDPVILRRTCETLWALGHADEALLLYDEVLERSQAGQRAEPSPDPIVQRR